MKQKRMIPDNIKTSSSTEMVDKYDYSFYNQSAVLQINDFLCNCTRLDTFDKSFECERE